MGRVPMLAAGHRQTVVRRIPDFRSRRAAMRCLAVSRRGLVGGGYRPAAVVGERPVPGSELGMANRA